MIRMRAIKDANVASSYYGKSDGGYYLDSSDLRREVGGVGAKRLGLSSVPDFDQFKRLLQGLDPHTGEQLTAKLVPGRLAGWDVTASIPKGVTVALERGDSRIHDALWEAGRETMADLESIMTTRERKGGAQENRTTGNMIWYGFEHPETRPAKDNGMPDPDRHIHFVIPNITWDAEENQWKAIKFRPVMDLRKWFDRRFDMRLASKLADLGYGIESKYKADDRGSKRYFSWDIKDMPQSVVKKFSRRAGEVEHLADKLGIQNPVSKDKLGATSRQHKRDDMTLADYRAYWDGRVSPEEAKKVTTVIKTAILGTNPRPDNTADKGVAYAIAHHFERQSVMGQADLEITAMERCMGGAKPEQIGPQMQKQGVLLRDGQATTKDVLAEEARVIAFAREGKASMRPLATSGKDPHPGSLLPQGQPKVAPSSTLSAEQAAMVNHVLRSPDQVVLVIGDAGTGKTRSIKAAFKQIDQPIELLAPSADASRGVLREEGFSKADTVASFLLSEKRQAGVKNGVIWIDEAGLLPIRDLSRLTEIARQQDARLVLQGDPKQHKSVVRHGNMMNVLQEYAGLPVGRLTEIWRQQHKGYKQVVADIAGGKGMDGFDKLNELGWVKQIGGNTPLVDDYLAGLKAGKQMLVIAPTHLEGAEITGEIRNRLKDLGKLGKEETIVAQLKPLNWTEAEKGDLVHRADGTEVLVFHRNSGTFKAGQKVRVADWKKSDHFKSPAHFSVYSQGATGLASGDKIRITANGKTKDGHKLNNGSVYQVKGFDKNGDIVLGNGWTVDKDFGFLNHGYVTTSHASQGKTVDRVLIAMGSESRGAINAEQFYVSVSRGKERATVYSDMTSGALRDAIQKTDPRKSATELMTPKPKRKRRSLMTMIRERYDRLRDLFRNDNRTVSQQQEKDRYGHTR